jgi:hypothetical protein
MIVNLQAMGVFCTCIGEVAFKGDRSSFIDGLV